MLISCFITINNCGTTNAIYCLQDHFKLFRSLPMMKFNHTSTFNKAAILLIGSLSLISIAVPYAMADSKTKEMATEAPADADYKN